jgi:hypothetical protein
MSHYKYTILLVLFAILILLLPHGLYENIAAAGLGLTVIRAVAEVFGGRE